MYTTQDFQTALTKEGKNTMIGMHFSSLLGERNKDNTAFVHYSLFSEVVVFAWKLDKVDLISGGYQLGTLEYYYHAYKADQAKQYRKN